MLDGNLNNPNCQLVEQAVSEVVAVTKCDALKFNVK